MDLPAGLRQAINAVCSLLHAVQGHGEYIENKDLNEQPLEAPRAAKQKPGKGVKRTKIAA